jgi:hypothetical protein
VNVSNFAEAMDRPSLASLRYAGVNCSGARPLRKNAQEIAGKIKRDVKTCWLAEGRALNYPRTARLPSTFASANDIAKFFPAA